MRNARIGASQSLTLEACKRWIDPMSFGFESGEPGRFEALERKAKGEQPVWAGSATRSSVSDGQASDSRAQGESQVPRMDPGDWSPPSKARKDTRHR